MILDIFKFLTGVAFLIPFYNMVNERKVEELFETREASFNWILVFAVAGFALIFNALIH